jgi:hypothetical protein
MVSSPLTKKPQKDQEYVTFRALNLAKRQTRLFTYPVADRLLEAGPYSRTRPATPGQSWSPTIRKIQNKPEAPSFRNLQHRPADRIFNWTQGGAVHLQAPPYYENLRALVARSVSEQGTVFLPRQCRPPVHKCV